MHKLHTIFLSFFMSLTNSIRKINRFPVKAQGQICRIRKKTNLKKAHITLLQGLSAPKTIENFPIQVNKRRLITTFHGWNMYLINMQPSSIHLGTTALFLCTTVRLSHHSPIDHCSRLSFSNFRIRRYLSLLIWLPSR
jgi:hypothetical protein